MGEVHVRRATAGDALVVAALRLQAARAAGASPEPGFLDRFAAAWDAQVHPTWVAERDGLHAGVLIGHVVADLPWPGRATVRRLHVVTLHAPVDPPPRVPGASGAPDASGGSPAGRARGGRRPHCRHDALGPRRRPRP